MLRVAILSCHPGAYSTRRLREACIRRGHEARVLNTLRFSLLVQSEKPQLFYNNQRLGRYDAVIPRIGAKVGGYGLAVVRQFEQMGIFSLNSAQAIAAARDKLRSMQSLSKHAIGIPPTAFAHGRDAVIPSIERVGGAPVILKLLEGAQGIGVILAETNKIAEAIVEALQTARQNVVIQRFVAESRGRDLRAFVVGERVVAAMCRTASGDEFRANVHRGGRVEKAILDPMYERTAIQAAQILGLRIAGVDMLETREGPVVLEVNASPGLEGIESATRVNIADEIAALLEEQVSFPDLDLRQRLTLKSGYTVVEFTVPATSSFSHKTLRELGLRDYDVAILNVTRGAQVFPNPRGDLMLLPGDSVLCFGQHNILKELMPRAAPELVLDK